MQSCNYGSVYHNQWNKMDALFFGGGGRAIEGRGLLINTIPEPIEHTKLLTWLFPFSPPSCPELQSSCHNYSSSGVE